MSELDGVDLIVFGGGIGEHSPEIRGRILRGFEWAGIGMDPERPRVCWHRGEHCRAISRAAIEVIRVDEASILAGEQRGSWGAPLRALPAPPHSHVLLVSHSREPRGCIPCEWTKVSCQEVVRVGNIRT